MFCGTLYTFYALHKEAFSYKLYLIDMLTLIINA